MVGVSAPRHPEPVVKIEPLVPSFLRAGDLANLLVRLQNPSGQSRHVCLVARSDFRLVANSMTLRAGGSCWMVFVLPVGQFGLFRTELELREEGSSPHLVRIAVPILRDTSGEAPLREAVWRGERGKWAIPLVESLQVERRLRGEGEQVFPRNDREGWRVPWAAQVRVCLTVSGPPASTVHLVDSLPAGLLAQEPLDLRVEDGCIRASQVRAEVGELEATVELSRGSSKFILSYAAAPVCPGRFIVPRARVWEGDDPAQNRGQTAWDVVEVNWPDPTEEEGRPRMEGVVDWGPSPSMHVTWDDIVAYQFMFVGQEYRRGSVKRDGSVWEMTSRQPLRERLFMYGLVVPVLILLLPIFALVALAGWLWRALTGQSPAESGRIEILGNAHYIDRLPERTTRKVRARLRELGCPQPHVQRR